MTLFNDVTNLITVVPAHPGYPPTGTKLPYVVTRPLILDAIAEDFSIAGDSGIWDLQFSVYCCGASVEASYNLALEVMRELQGQRVGGTTLNTSTGYVGAPVEGHYETQVTVQLNQGGI